MAILNQRDLKSVRSRLTQLQAALGNEAVFDELASGLSADIAVARRHALAAEARKLSEDVEAYEKLQSSSGDPTELVIDDLGLLPIIGRIARKLSQRELANLLGVSEQQIQRYESDRYATVNLSRYKKILEILGLDLHSRLKSSWPNPTSPEIKLCADLELDDSLVAAIRKRSWVALPKGTTKEGAAQILATYVSEGTEFGRGRSLHRRRQNTDNPLNASALAIWRARVLREAALQRQKNLKSKFNIVDTAWIPKLANLSTRPDGPLKAIEILREHGIILVIVPHLPHTLLDGAALLLADGTPVIALTLRYDRLDSYWFTLFHEIGHVFLHFHELDAGFVDDLDIRSENQQEKDADTFALSATVNDHVWETAPARFSKSSDVIKKMSESLGIHPAIIAGRIRRERSDYKIFTDMVGSGLVRSLFADQIV